MKTQTYMGKVADTPLGDIWVAASAAGLTAVSLWGDEDRFVAEVSARTGAAPILELAQVTAVVTQLRDYLAGERTTFNLPVDWSVMTPFQQTVLRAVCGVGYGRLETYRDIAGRIGRPNAVRAVGRANATNPMPIIIPCHRILGSDGKLHGYSAPGGLETKAWLLRLEGSWLL